MEGVGYPVVLKSLFSVRNASRRIGIGRRKIAKYGYSSAQVGLQLLLLIYCDTCHLSAKNYHFPDNLPRCQAFSANRLSHIRWRGTAMYLFSFFTSLFRQTPQLMRQDIWEMRQEMLETGRISGTSEARRGFWSGKETCNCCTL